MSRPFLLVCGTFGLVMTVAACNTDNMWDARPAPAGPVTTLDAPAEVHVPDINVDEVHEVDIVESVLTHRALYRRYLQILHDYYRDQGSETKRQWAANELRDVDRIKPFRYIVDAEIPNKDLRPTSSVATADQMYKRAVDLMREGGHGVPMLFRESKMKEAANLFTQLIDLYPNSDKIDDAAFFLGEIHKEYLPNQETLAAQWYERSLMWNPKSPHPVRFQAAVCYDYRLHDRKRALELYQAVLQDETDNRSNLDWATMRIRQLTEDRTAFGQREAQTEAESARLATTLASPGE